MKKRHIILIAVILIALAITATGCRRRAPPNYAPSISQSIDISSIRPNQTFEIKITATDANGISKITSTIEPATQVCSGSKTCVKTWTKSENSTGGYSYTFVAYDSTGKTRTKNVNVNVVNNSAPVLGAIGNKIINESQLLEFDVSATDDDDDDLTVNATNLPSGASFADETFSWTPGHDDAGVYNMTFRVKDIFDAGDSETITITVDDANQAPEINIPDQQLPENSNKTINLTDYSSDGDNDPLTYSIINKTINCTVSGELLLIIPKQGWHGVAMCAVQASDGTDSGSDEFNVNVTELNDPAEIIADGKEGWKTYNLLFAVNASDPENDTVTLWAEEIPAGAVFVNGTFNWTPGPGQHGIHAVVFKANDGNSNSSKEINITVHDSCHVNSDCDDGSDNTIDVCNFNSDDWNGTYPSCSNWIPNLYGQVLDADTGDPVFGANISFYNASVWDCENLTGNMTGNFSILEPKQVPDAMTDAEGHYYVFLPTNESMHIVVQGSREKDFDHKANNQKKKDKEIVLPEGGFVKVTFEKASATLKSDLYISAPFEQMLVANSSIGTQVELGYHPGLTELKFYIRVHAGVWGAPEYYHYSDTEYAIVDRLDYDTWRIHFEDLNKNYFNPDWDFNDAVVLVDLLNMSGSNETYDNDCDGDGKKNWVDDDDDWCDFGEHDSEVDENSSQYTDFNIEGHIIYSGRYEGNNNYTCQEKVKFTMFGINRGSENITVTYVVENHTVTGKPTEIRTNCTVDGRIVYCGNEALESENLFVPNDKKKHQKFYDFTIPCGWASGKYDIHVYDNEKWGNMHKIGNFFIVEDVTPPYVNSDKSKWGFTNQTIGNIWYIVEDEVQDGTVRATADAQGLSIQISTSMSEFGAYIDKDITVDGNDTDALPDNDRDLTVSAGDSYFNLTYDKSGYYTARVMGHDSSGNMAHSDINISVYITEEEADVIGMNIYDLFSNLNGLMGYDIDYTTGVTETTFDINVDRFDWAMAYMIGDEYRTPDNTIHDWQAEELLDIIDGCLGPEYIKPINLSTETEYNQTLFNFMMDLQCRCGQTLSGPSCP